MRLFVVVAAAWLALATATGAGGSGIRGLRSWDSHQMVRRGRLGSPRMHAEGACDLCRDNWLFILAAGGRTGSTTALTMFSGVPGFAMSGEHWGFLKEYAAILKHLKATQRQKGVSWRHRGLDSRRFACSVQHLVKNVVLGNSFEQLARNSTVFGFKEIRYTNPEMLRFIWQAFPCARVVFTYRENTGARVKAPQFKEPRLQQEWQKKGSVVLAVHKAFPNTTGLLGVESLSVADYNAILHGTLGVKGCSFSHIVHENANGGYKHDAAGERGLIEGTCDMPSGGFRLSPWQIEVNRGRMWRLYNELTAAVAEAPAEAPPASNNGPHQVDAEWKSSQL